MDPTPSPIRRNGLPSSRGPPTASRLPDSPDGKEFPQITRRAPRRIRPAHRAHGSRDPDHRATVHGLPRRRVEEMLDLVSLTPEEAF